MQGADLAAILDMGPIDPAALALLSKGQRQRAQAGIDALLDYLDAVTPDADLEPSFGFALGLGELDEAEAVDEDGDDLDRGEHDPSDYEPALGAPEGTPDLPGHWGVNSRSAFEDEDEGWDEDWENEKDERDLPTPAEYCRLLEVV